MAPLLNQILQAGSILLRPLLELAKFLKNFLPFFIDQ